MTKTPDSKPEQVRNNNYDVITFSDFEPRKTINYRALFDPNKLYTLKMIDQLLLEKENLDPSFNRIEIYKLTIAVWTFDIISRNKFSHRFGI